MHARGLFFAEEKPPSEGTEENGQVEEEEKREEEEEEEGDTEQWEDDLRRSLWSIDKLSLKEHPRLTFRSRNLGNSILLRKFIISDNIPMPERRSRSGSESDSKPTFLSQCPLFLVSQARLAQAFSGSR